MTDHRQRPTWTVPRPTGGWGPPWPQALELLGVLPGDRWTLIGGLMVQLHAAYAGLPPTRTTDDVDLLLHIETGATTFLAARSVLENELSYELQIPDRKEVAIHRFVRPADKAVIDVMVADHLPPKYQPTAAGHPVFQVPAGTSALRKTVNCKVAIDESTTVTLSIPDVLGALVLKGAAFTEDSRDRERHLDDAAMLACTIVSPSAERKRMEGRDRTRIVRLAHELADPSHRSWMLIPVELRQRGIDALAEMASEPTPESPRRRLGAT